MGGPCPQPPPRAHPWSARYPQTITSISWSARAWAPPAGVLVRPRFPPGKGSGLLTPAKDWALALWDRALSRPGKEECRRACGVQRGSVGWAQGSRPRSLAGRPQQAGPGSAAPAARPAWPRLWWAWAVQDLTEVAQAVLPGVDAHLQHGHQPKVIHLGQGPLQKPMGSQPGGLDSGPSLPGACSRPFLTYSRLAWGAPGVWCRAADKAGLPSGPSKAPWWSLSAGLHSSLSLGIAELDPALPFPTVQGGDAEGPELSWWLGPLMDSCLLDGVGGGVGTTGMARGSHNCH